MFDDELKGNLTTVVKFVVMTVAPYFGVAEATRNELVSVALAGVGLALAYLDAKHHNTIIGNNSNDGNDDDSTTSVCDSGVASDSGLCFSDSTSINDSLSKNEEEEMLTPDTTVANVSEAIKNDVSVNEAVTGVSETILKDIVEKEEKT